MKDQYGFETVVCFVFVALGSNASLMALVTVSPKLSAVDDEQVREEGAGGLTLGDGEAAFVDTPMAMIAIKNN